LKFISWRINGKNDQSLIGGGKIVEFRIAGDRQKSGLPFSI
jgi:hypothetical protein